MQLSSKARKAVAIGLAASTMVWGAGLIAPIAASAALHSDGCLVLSGGAVWLITNNTRRGFTSAEVFMSHGYNFTQVVTASSEDTALSVGPIMVYANGSLVMGPNDPLVYLVVNGQKRGFTTAAVFTGLGYSWGNIFVAPANTFADLPVGSNINSSSETGLPSGHPVNTAVTCTTGSGGLTGGEGELKNFDATSPADNSFEEGDTAELLAFEMEADGSDMRVTRVDVYLDQTEAAESDNADDYFDSARLMVDGDEVDEVDVSDWDEEDYAVVTGADGDEFRIRFLTNFVVQDGDVSEVAVEFDATSNIDSGDSDNAIWIIDTETDSVRAEDATGVSDEYGVAIEESVNVDDVTAGDLDVSLSTDNPDEQVVAVDATDDTNGVEVFAFDLEANDGDIDVQDILVQVDDVGTLTDLDAVVNTLHLFMNGDEIASESMGSAVGTTVDITFDVDGDVMIEDGDTAEFTVEVDVNNLDGGDFDEGDGVVLSFDSVNAEDQNGDNVEADGAAAGENFHFYTVAPVITKVSASITKNAGDNTSAEGTDDTADGTIVFTVEAMGGTVYINGDNETTDEKEGVLLSDGVAGDLDALGDYSYTVTGANVTTTNGGADNEYFTIPEGAEATITLSFHIDSAADGFFGGNVDGVQWGTVVTDEDTRSANNYNFGVVTDDLETSLVQLDDGA